MFTVDTMDPTTKYEYTSEASGYHANYMRNSKAIGVLWGVFTICFAIINAVVFIQPQWIGDTPDSRGTGYFGLWQSCRQSIQDGQELVCHGRLDDFASIPSPAFKMATIFIGLSAIAIVLCILFASLSHRAACQAIMPSYHQAGSTDFYDDTRMLPLWLHLPQRVQVSGNWKGELLRS
ncbi:LHFPL tetraspan subfamily member 4 protein [Araneus ventricosus]|uniref:LHFPL tetraspan subfamily member 4 protein n=1 Tax=Araneus ventricosus TaxID=182803 RepID=A0A4Y2MD82_ARAVE|nr:LHFPL tetraspan subfamily member 4 protein [Araneus ventricosus]